MSTNNYPSPIRLDNQVSAKIIARAWLDPEFKAKLIADPVGVLREAGVVIPDGMQFEVKEQAEPSPSNLSHPVYYLVLPPRPSADQIGGGRIEDLVASKCSGTWHSLCGCS